MCGLVDVQMKKKVIKMRVSVDYCALYGCPTYEASCDRKREYGCAGCTELRHIPKFLVDKMRW